MDRIGHYEIVRELGGGNGSGRVLLAHDTDLGREVALKVIRPDSSWNPQDWEEFQQRFDSEARAAAGLKHPNITAIYERKQLGEQTYIAMEYVSGETLESRLQREPKVAAEDAVSILRQVAGALDFAHSKGVVHRDVKPVNILLQEDGKAMVMDFGIAKKHAEGTSSEGGALYVAPECQAGQNAASPQSDQWALAVVAYRLLTGKEPFHCGGPQGVGEEIRRGRLVDPQVSNPGLPEGAAEALKRALAPDPSLRFEDCRAFVQRLDHGLAAPPQFRQAAPKPMQPAPSAVQAPPPPQVPPPVALQQQPQPPVRPVPAKKSVWSQAGAFLALPLAAAALYGLYWVMNYEPPVPPPPPKIEFFRVGESYQNNRGGEWTVRVEWSTTNGETVLLEPDPGRVEASGQRTYEIRTNKTITLRVKNSSGEAAHEITLEPLTSPNP